MFSKATVTLAALAIAQVALAQPYCLLTAVNKFEHPADQKTLCCSEASKVKEYLKELCPSGDQTDAVNAFNTACKDAGYGTCSSSSSSIKSLSATGASGKASATGAPYPVVKTSTYYDTECSCTKTKVQTSQVAAGSTGFATGTGAPAATGTGAGTAATGGAAGGAAGGSGSAATGSPIAPPGSSGTGSSTSPSTTSFKGAATRNVGSVAAGLLAVAAIAMAL